MAPLPSHTPSSRGRCASSGSVATSSVVLSSLPLYTPRAVSTLPAEVSYTTTTGLGTRLAGSRILLQHVCRNVEMVVTDVPCLGVGSGKEINKQRDMSFLREDDMAARAVAGPPNNKGGYDYDFVSPPPKSLECPVCLMTFRDPHVISCCGNEFCQLCIERVQRDGKPCPLCNKQDFSTMLHKKLAREVKALIIHCPHKEQGCQWEGELGQLPNHLNPKVGTVNGCGYMIVACSYKCGVYLQRRNIREHEMEICPKHPIKMQVAGLMRKFETITTENQFLRRELHIIKEAHEKEIKEMKVMHESELNALKQELDEVKSKNDKTCDKLKEKQTTLKLEVKETLKRLEEKCMVLQNDKIPLSLSPFYFEMLNVDHYLRHNLQFISDPFYSHPGGYKMGISVYSNAEYGRSSTHLCLYALIFRGEFDDHLKWPFDGEVTVQAYNRTQGRWSKEAKIQLNERKCDPDVVGRQVGHLTSAGWGCPKFLSYSEFKMNFVKDTNTASFRVKVNMSCR